MYTIVTGAAGFIGSNIVKALNDRGEKNIIAVDNLKRADKFRNLVDCEIADYLDKEDFLDRLPDLRADKSGTIDDARHRRNRNARHARHILDIQTILRSAKETESDR